VVSAQAPQVRDRLLAILGPDGVVAAGAEGERYLHDHRRLYSGQALAIVRPRSVPEISRLLSFCNSERIGVVPQGGNTSYCGGATPDESGSQVVVSLERLNRIRGLDAANSSLTVEAGCILQRAQQAADEAGLFFPLSLGSEGSCHIGGNLSTNAGGTSVLRYGMMRDLVLGLEVVLADGRVLDGLTALRKDNTGYDIKGLFLGAEGTLGIITAATLKLFPKPRTHATAFAAVPDVAAAVALLGQVRAASGERVTSFELIPRVAVELTTRHIEGVRDPLNSAHPWYVLCELSSSRAAEALDPVLEDALAASLEAGTVLDAALARSEREREAFWKLRETVPEAQRREGASLKHDVSLPIGALADFVARAGSWLSEHVPDGCLVAYGHVGDGNLHFNLTQRAGADARTFLAREAQVRRMVHDLVRECGGSFSAEHGIGRLKVAELERYAPPVELELMRLVKRALDPNGIMNPGKVLRACS
jgi:D-lactate dehydrogenase (cytochrome)